MPFFRHNGGLHYFAHVPKCGGISVEAHLEARFGELAFRDDDYLKLHPGTARWSRSSPQHVPWGRLLTMIPEAWIESVFTVVRHPVLRVVSAYNFQVTKMRIVPAGLTIEAWFEDFLAGRDAYPYAEDNHLRPQVDFAPAEAAFFRLEAGLSPVADWLDDRFGASDAPPIGHLNDSTVEAPGLQADEGAPPALARRIADVYGADFDRYGFPAEPPVAPVIRTPVTGSTLTNAIGLATYRGKKRIRRRLRTVLS